MQAMSATLGTISARMRFSLFPDSHAAEPNPSAGTGAASHRWRPPRSRGMARHSPRMRSSGASSSATASMRWTTRGTTAAPRSTPTSRATTTSPSAASARRSRDRARGAARGWACRHPVSTPCAGCAPAWSWRRARACPSRSTPLDRSCRCRCHRGASRPGMPAPLPRPCPSLRVPRSRPAAPVDAAPTAATPTSPWVKRAAGRPQPAPRRARPVASSHDGGLLASWHPRGHRGLTARRAGEGAARPEAGRAARSSLAPSRRVTAWA